MKKLFTTLLLLGAVGYAQAQVTVTGYDAEKKTVTINYNRAAGLSTESMVEDAIKAAFQGLNGQGPTMVSTAMSDPAMKAAVATIKLTGDWENRDTDKDGAKTIKKIVDKFGDANAPDTLDLSQCKKFCSEFISVKDVINGTEMGPTQTCPGYETDQHVTTFTANYKLPDETVTGTGEIIVKYFNSLESWGTEIDGQPEQHYDVTYWYNYNQVYPKVFVKDAEGNELLPTSYTDNGDGTCTYSLTITHDGTKFLINKEYNLAGIIFPVSDKFTFIPDDQFIGAQKLKKVVLSEKMVAIGNDAFSGLTGFEEINFPASLREIGKEAFLGSGIKAAELAVCTQLKRLRYETFEDANNLATVTFPSSLIEIQNDCFQRTGITKADMSECHLLRVIGQKAFSTCPSLTEVRVCSHPKKIKGVEGSGAFNNSTAIRTVEVVGCDNTNLVECICENNAFDPKITYVQTAIDNIETMGARLIFPEGMQYDQPMKSSAGNVNTEYLGYASAFDYFVGNYKEGIPFKNNQSCLEAYFKFAPRGVTANAVNWPTTGETTQVTVASDVAMKNKYGISNGWHEFMNVSAGIIINNEDQNFLRTYSRTRGSGPVLLKNDLGIIAYRAVDYLSTKDEYVANKRGDYVFVPGEKNKLHPGTDEYLTKKQCKDAGINIKGLKTYSYATVAGTLYLRPLHPKYKNSDEVNEDYSYIPELTGVVLYSNKTAEDIFLIFPPYTDTDYDLSIQYPHTGKVRRESTRLESEPDDINMLQGSYGEDTGVAPVDPWTYADEENFKGGTYNPAQIDYRQFGYSISQEKWIRLQPGRMKYNRAFAKIPAEFFNNHNEGKDGTGEFPDFTLSDVPEETTPADSEGEANTLLLIDYSFDDVAAETDGIKTINETDHVVDANVWYTLQGVKVTQPVKGGVYIHNNKKVVIK